LREPYETAVEVDWEDMAASSVESWKSDCEEKTLCML
jgi:hypothetical protein